MHTHTHIYTYTYIYIYTYNLVKPLSFSINHKLMALAHEMCELLISLKHLLSDTFPIT